MKIFLTGAPGSKWSGIAQILETAPHMNTSDRSLSRQYVHHMYSGHVGAYFGRGCEFEAKLDSAYIDSAYVDPFDGIQIVKSHDWANMLPEVANFCTGTEHKIMMVYRPDLTCQAWWHEAGGENISYPDYSDYLPSSKMLYEIQQINNNMLAFAHEHDLSWNAFTKEWCRDLLGNDVTDFESMPDILVAVYV